MNAAGTGGIENRFTLSASCHMLFHYRMDSNAS
jgi:hypothetical protein